MQSCWGEVIDRLDTSVGASCLAAFLALAFLKTFGFLSVSWWWVTVPLWLPLSLLLMLFLILVSISRIGPSIRAVVNSAVDLVTLAMILALQALSTLLKKLSGDRTNTGAPTRESRAPSPVGPLDDQLDRADDIVTPMFCEVSRQGLISRDSLAGGQRPGAVKIDIRQTSGEFFGRAGKCLSREQCDPGVGKQRLAQGGAVSDAAGFEFRRQR